MNPSEQEKQSDLFIVLGGASPQRYEVVFQMVAYLLFNGETVDLWHHKDEPPPESPSLTPLLTKGLTLHPWSLEQDSCAFAQPPTARPGVTTLFLAHGSLHLVDTLETLAYWLPNSGFSLQRITTWVDCLKVSQSTRARKWYECCFHFSDLVILDEFKTLPVSWLKEYKDFFKRECYPCIIDNTRKGRLHDFPLIMDNQVRRIAQLFESPEAAMLRMDEDEDDEEEDSIDLTLPENEPYFERLIDGRRSKLVPEPD